METNKRHVIEITVPWPVKIRLEKEAETIGVSLDTLVNSIIREQLDSNANIAWLRGEYRLTDNA